jgi:hypothetical protein
MNSTSSAKFFGTLNSCVRMTFFSLLAATLLVGASAHAQLSGKGAISGSVFDTTGAAIPGASVTATNTANDVSATTTTTSAGDYTFSTLDPGVYKVTVTAKGFSSLTQEDIHVNALEEQTFNPKLQVGASTDTVTVSTLPPQLETSNATLGATMENEMYSALPIEMGAYGQADQRRATDFAFLMPGVQGNNTTGNPTTNTGIVDGSGSRGGVSVVYVDGTAFVRAGGNGDPRYVWTAISVDAVDQFQLQTSGYSAIYEGQGIQNYTIKQGGPQYHGSIYEFFRNTALDTYGWLGSVPNPATGKVVKPIEHSNEYGINLSGPLLPLSGWKDKLFFFGNYDGFRYSSETPTQIAFPTALEQAGNFQGVLANTPGTVTAPTNAVSTSGIYDPSTAATCTANNSGKPCRYRYGFGPGGVASATAPGGAIPQCAAPYNCVDVIPAGELSTVAMKMQSYLPTGIGTSVGNNYVSPNRTGLVNWSTTDRIDYVINPKNSLTMIGAIGRQASSNPVGQTTSGRNVGPIPYNYGQTYAPKTAVGIIEETWTVTPHIVNQLKYGYARYNGPTFDADQLPAYSATSLGLTNTPAGAASGAFPITTFAGTNAPTQWGGTTPSVTLAENYTLTDNLQWVVGKHSITVGGQSAWLLYNVVNATGGTTPLTLANAVSETAGFSGTSTGATLISGSGASYASFLVGQIDKASFTQYLQQEFGARFRAISPYIQDTWKVTPKLTADIGLRFDFFPSVTEVHNAGSYFSPTLLNPVTGVNGALQFTGSGNGTCNCSSPVNNYYKNFGPRIGLAYQLDAKTVIRASYGVMFTHGNAVGGSATSLGTLGFSGGLSASSSTSTYLSSAPLTGMNGALPGYTAPTGVTSGPQFGTGYTTTAGYTGSPQSMGYVDPYLGGRAPEYINWTFGFQKQWTSALASNITYVGSQGHFLPADGSNARGYYADQLDPKYLYLGTKLNDSAAAMGTDCTTLALPCPTAGTYATSQNLGYYLKPFPFQTVGDSFGYVANSNYNALQASFNMRPYRGLTFMANYTWSRSIDDGGTFRTGYAIPAGVTIDGKAWSQDRIERSVSTSNQPEHVVITGVYELPFGKQVANKYVWERAAFGGFKFSEIFQAFSGSPLAITASSCQTNPALTCNEPNLNPNWASGNPRVNGKWGAGALAGTTNVTYIAPSGGTAAAPTGPFIAPSVLANSTIAPAYTIPNSPRTAPYDLYGPGNYQLDISLVRSIPLHITEASRFEFRADMYNVTNKTFFALQSTQLGNAAFGAVTTSSNYNRRAAQLSARISF